MMTSRFLRLGLAAAALGVFAAVPAHAGITTTPFTGSADAVVAQTGTFQVTGNGTTSGLPFGLTQEHFVYNVNPFSINFATGTGNFTGTDTFSTGVAGGPLLVADVAGSINITTYSGQSTGVFDSAASTQGFFGATGTLADSIVATDVNAKKVHETYTGTLNTVAAVPEASSIVSLGLMLAMGLGGVLIARRRKSAV